jgi:hypothetical protein
MFWELFEHYKPDVVVFDTLSTFIEGDENSSETFFAFDRRVTLPLIKREVTVLIADHAGKDVTRDARGSSAKRAKIHAEWLMTRSPSNRDELRRSIRKDRNGVLDQEFLLTRHDDPLRHEQADPLTATIDFTRERSVGAPRSTLKASLRRCGSSCVTTPTPASDRPRKSSGATARQFVGGRAKLPVSLRDNLNKISTARKKRLPDGSYLSPVMSLDNRTGKIAMHIDYIRFHLRPGKVEALDDIRCRRCSAVWCRANRALT